jgi:hypothetical protein
LSNNPPDIYRDALTSWVPILSGALSFARKILYKLTSGAVSGDTNFKPSLANNPPDIYRDALTS